MSKKSRQRKSHDKRPSDSSVANPLPIAPAQPISRGKLPLSASFLQWLPSLPFRVCATTISSPCDDNYYVLENPACAAGIDRAEHRVGIYHLLAAQTGTRSRGSPTWSTGGSMAITPAATIITNLCLHAANAVLLFLLLLYMTGSIGPFRNRRISLRAASRAC